MRWIEQIHIYIFKLSFVFLTAWAAFLSRSVLHSVMHSIYICTYVFIYMYIYTLCVYGLIGRRPSAYERMFIRSDSFTCYLFFSLSLHTAYNLSNIKLYYTHIYIHMCIQYFYDEKKRFFKERAKKKELFDNLLFLFLFPFLFLYWLIAN